MAEAVPDDLLRATLGRFAALAGLALRDPGAWLGGDDGDGGAGVADEDEGLLRRAREEIADRLRGEVHPGSRGWEERPVQERVDWWLGTVGTYTSAVAATPRFFGLVADRLPVQGAFAVASQGLAVCATAHEHGERDPRAWVPLLGRVLFDRDLAAADAPAGLAGGSAREEAEAGAREMGDATGVARRGPLRRTAGMLWRLGRTLVGLQGLFDDRPRGPWRYRALGKLPVVGVVGGFLDERGALRSASAQTEELLRRR